ncbi:transcription termination/antitermination NusG family protein [Bacterioplanoides sp. SCSIO 12839]|uniref:transcription termination/antitermination NusG family protein n=1 Tax=Bacterioplanoides sp. SCSIO 12839 TaxID=2829569 RepID=UPI002101F37D|nr:transcription termination/antitermination NusG family protein [Bacterioplanoides sp. SCSIO 12839]UTW49484.1 transcription/translation regulatory transformer protein RfaH [Bacterioplanoides sp. SCSIO 12839]
MSGVAVTESWYVVLTKPRQEKRALHHLHEQGGEVFLPYLQVQKIRSGVLSEEQEVMFPGYLFLKSRSDSPLLNKVRSTPGARMLLRFGVNPVVVYQALIDSLRSHCFKGLSEEVFDVDQQVRINTGPFKDYLALFKEYDGEKRAIVLLNLLDQQRELVVELTQLSA